MGIKHVVVAGLREKNADSTNASFNGRAFLSCSPDRGGKGAPYCSETRLSGKSRAVVFARGETMRGKRRILRTHVANFRCTGARRPVYCCDQENNARKDQFVFYRVLILRHENLIVHK